MRRVGIAGLQQEAARREQLKKVGEGVKEANLAQMSEALGTFKAKLEEFAAKHTAAIRKDPQFRAEFHAMCANIGVDPLASNKGMWAELLGIGDFYYELGIQIIEAAWATRAHNGGLMELPALLAAVQRRRGRLSEAVSEDDVVRAIKKLKVLANGFDLVTIGKRQYVRSVPGELNMDKNAALEAAQEAAGGLSKAALRQRCGWAEERAQGVLDALLREGLAMVDDQAGGATLYWFPCVDGPAAAAAK